MPVSESESSRRVVLAFFNEGLVGRSPATAFERYVSPAFVEHKPDVPEGTREAAATYLGELMDELPEARWEVVRTIAENDFVVVHARFTPAPGAPPYAIADIFRLEDGLIVEHWDAVGAPPREQANPNSRF